MGKGVFDFEMCIDYDHNYSTSYVFYKYFYTSLKELAITIVIRFVVRSIVLWIKTRHSNSYLQNGLQKIITAEICYAEKEIHCSDDTYAY